MNAITTIEDLPNEAICHICDQIIVSYQSMCVVTRLNKRFHAVITHCFERKLAAMAPVEKSIIQSAIHIWHVISNAENVFKRFMQQHASILYDWNNVCKYRFHGPCNIDSICITIVLEDYTIEFVVRQANNSVIRYTSIIGTKTGHIVFINSKLRKELIVFLEALKQFGDGDCVQFLMLAKTYHTLKLNIKILLGIHHIKILEQTV